MSCIPKIIFSIFFFFTSILCAEGKKPYEHEVKVEIKIQCPMSEELIRFVQSLPNPENQDVNFEAWKTSFVQSMSQLIRLVESEKISHSSWSAKTDDPLWQRVKTP